MRTFQRLRKLYQAVQPVIGRMLMPTRRGRRGAGHTLEILEPRQYLASVPGTVNADAFLLRLDAAGSNVEVFVNQTTTPDYTVPLTETITIDAGGGDDAITVGQSGATATFPSEIRVNAGSGADTLHVRGQTSVTLNTTFGAGVTGENLSINVHDSAVVSFPQTQVLGALNILDTSRVNLPANSMTAPLSPHKTLVLGSLSIAQNASNQYLAKLDLTNNDMIVRDGDRDAITAMVASGYNGGNWQGNGILTSVAGQQVYSGLMMMGLAKNSDRSTPLGTFAGHDLFAGDVTIKFTYQGDSDLNGTVNALDYFLIDSGFLASSEGWYNGDYNYDGSINGLDYFAIDRAYLSQEQALSPSLSGDSLLQPNQSYTLTLNAGGYTPNLTGWTVYWGDGTYDVFATTTASVQRQHQYTQTGDYTVIAVARGTRISYYTTKRVKVRTHPLAVFVQDTSAFHQEGQPLSFTSQIENETGGTPTYAWSILKDGAAYTPPAGTVTDGPALDFTPENDGAYQVTLTVTANGIVDTDEKLVAVEVGAPTVSLSGAASVDEGSPFVLSLSVANPGTDQILSWSITWGDGSTDSGTGSPPDTKEHTYADGIRSYNISVTVTDEDATATTSTSTDVTFGTNGQRTDRFEQYPVNWAEAVVVQPDGKIVAVGAAGTSTRFAVVRYDTQGAPDPDFAGGKITTPLETSAIATGVALLSDGRIVVAGTSYDANNDSAFALACYSPTGQLLWTRVDDFGAYSRDLINGIAIQKVGGEEKIIVAGSIDWAFAVARYDLSGQRDLNFADQGKRVLPFSGMEAVANAVIVQPDGKIVAAGYDYSEEFTIYDFALARLNSDGTLDPTFSGGQLTLDYAWGNDYAKDLAIQSDGKILVAGSVTTGSAGTDTALLRLSSAGVPDGDFGQSGGWRRDDFGGTDTAAGVAVQPDGQIVIAGTAAGQFAVARYDSSGQPDEGFGSGGLLMTAFKDATGNIDPSEAYALALQPDGRFVAAGYVEDPTNQYRFALARYPFVLVNDVAPTLTPGSSQLFVPNESFYLDLSSLDPGLDTISGWTVNWGDGTTADTFPSSSGTISHTYYTAGPGPESYLVTVTARDEDNLAPAPAYTATVRVYRIPDAPSSLDATRANDTEINLSWHDNSDYETGFVVEVSENGGSYEELDRLAPNSEAYTAIGLNNTWTYQFRVKSFIGTGFSDEAESQLVSPPTAPPPPTVSPIMHGVAGVYFDGAAYYGEDATVGYGPGLILELRWWGDYGAPGYGAGDLVVNVGGMLGDWNGYQQPVGVHGVSVLLPPRESYLFNFDYSWISWDTIYFDSFSLSVTDKPYPDVLPTDTIHWGFVGGASDLLVGEEAVPQPWGEFGSPTEVGFVGNAGRDNYLNIVLDTRAMSRPWQWKGLQPWVGQEPISDDRLGSAGYFVIKDFLSQFQNEPQVQLPYPSVSIAAKVPEASKVGSNRGVFTISRSGADNNAALTVYYTVSGSAHAGVDYQSLTGVATIAAGSDSVDIDIIPLSGAPSELNTVTVGLKGDSDYRLSDSRFATITLDNRTPLVRFTGPNSGSEGDPLSYQAQLDAAYQGQSLYYTWTVTKNGVAIASDAGQNMSSFTFVPPDNGAYELMLDARAGYTSLPSYTRGLFVQNVAPLVTITGAPQGNGETNIPIVLSGTVSDAGSADVTAGFSYDWTVFRNGKVVAIPASMLAADGRLNFVATDQGDYTVRLIVSDKDGGRSAAASIAFHVDAVPHPPQIDSLPPSTYLMPLHPWIPTEQAGVRWNRGDVFLSTTVGQVLRFDAAGKPYLREEAGELYSETLKAWNEPVRGDWVGKTMHPAMAFDADGNLYAPAWATAGGDSVQWLEFRIDRFAGRQTLLESPLDSAATEWPEDYSSITYFPTYVPEGIVIDATGNIYISGLQSPWRSSAAPAGVDINDRGLYRLTPAGEIVHRLFTDSDIQAIDLAADQHTLFFTHEWEGSISQIDLNTGETRVFWENNNLPAGQREESHALRLLPDGGMLVSFSTLEMGADLREFVVDEGIRRFSSDGRLLKTYDLPRIQAWYQIVLTPDGDHFLTTGSDSPGAEKDIWRFYLDDPEDPTDDRPPVRFADTAIENAPEIATSQRVGLAIYKGWTADAIVDEPFVGRISASDPDGDRLRYVFNGEAHGAVLDPLTGVMTWRPEKPGSYQFEVIVTEDKPVGAQYTTAQFTIDVDYDYKRNSPPSINADPLSDAMLGRPYTDRIMASDPDQQWLEYSLEGEAEANPVVTIDRLKGVINWTPTAEDARRGYRDITVRVTDPLGLWTARTFQINIKRPLVAGVVVESLGERLVEETINNVPVTSVKKLLRISPVPGHDSPGPSQNDPLAGAIFEWWVSSGEPVSADPTGSGKVVLYEWSGNNATLDTTLRVSKDGSTEYFVFSSDLAAIPGTVGFEGNDSLPTIVSPSNSISSPFPLNALVFNHFGQGLDHRAVTWDVTDAQGVSLGTHGTDSQGRTINGRDGVYLLPGGVTNSEGRSTAQVWIGTDPLDPNGGSEQVQDAMITASVGGIVAAKWVLARGSANPSIWFDQWVPVSIGNYVEGTAINPGPGPDQLIATFVAHASQAPSATARINWGDGTPVNVAPDVRVQIEEFASQTYSISVYGNHTYRKQGTYQFTIDLFDGNGNTLKTFVASNPIKVFDAGQELAVYSLNAAINSNFSDVDGLGWFKDLNPSANISDFRFEIDWGDGSNPSYGEPGAAVDGGYLIRGSHTYTSSGQFTLSIRVIEDYSNQTRQREVARGVGRVQVRPQSATPPEGLLAEALTSKIVKLTWTPVANAYGYQIQRQTYNAAGQPVGDWTNLQAADHFTSSPYYDQFLITPGTHYDYRVRSYESLVAYDPEGRLVDGSAYSDYTDAVPVDTPDIPAPIDLEAADVTAWDPDARKYLRGVQVYWKNGDTDRVGAGIVGYKIRRRVGQGSWQSLLPPKEYVNATSVDKEGRLSWFDDSATFPNGNELYEYEITAYDEYGDASQPQTKVVGPDATPPSKPTGLKAASYPQAIQLTWVDRPISELDWAGWNVYRSTDNGQTWQQLNDELIFQSTGFDDKTAPVGSVSHYRVASVDLAGNESQYAEVEKSRSHDGEPPAPTGLMGWLVTANTVRLQWKPVTPIEHLGHAGDRLSSYSVYRRNQQGQWEWIGTVAAAQPVPVVVTYDDANLAGNSAPQYRVKAVDGDGDESDPAEIGLTLGDGLPPAAPSFNLIITQTDNESATSSAQLSWSSTAAMNTYALYRRRADAQVHELVEELAGTTAGFTDDDLSPGTTYCYRLVATQTDGKLSWAELSANTPALPTGREYAPFLALDSVGSSTPVVVQADTAVSGIIDDPNNNLRRWQLVLEPLSGSATNNRYVVAEGIHEIGHRTATKDAIGTIRPTAVPNGVYKLVLQAWDGSEGAEQLTQYVNDAELIQIKTDLKVGSLTLPFVDMQVDVPGGQPIIVRRVYDSSRANELGDFGYGWFLELLNATPRTTAAPSSRRDGRALRLGDLVYLPVPGRGEQVFQFVPKPTNYKPDKPYAFGLGLYATYWPQFIAVDGSSAQLTITDEYGGNISLTRVGDEFAESLTAENFDPQNEALKAYFHLSTEDGTRYTIRASNGRIESSSDSNGNVTAFAGEGDGIPDMYSGNIGVQVNRSSDGRIYSIAFVTPTANGSWNNTIQSVNYVYFPSGNAAGQLKTLDGHTDSKAEFAYYEDSNHPHLLRTITDARGVKVVDAEYDDAGRVTKLTDVRHQSASANIGSFNGRTAATSVTDAQDNSTEQILDAYGNVVREIRQIKDTAGNIKYLVTVRDFVYQTQELLDPYVDGATSVNKLLEQTEWQPFEPTSPATRYSQRPTTLLRRVQFKTPNYSSPDMKDPGLWLPQFETTLSPNGTELVTEYSDYVLGKPGRVTDPYGNVTVFNYDRATGNLLSQTSQGETIYYQYTDGTAPYADLPKGLLLRTYRVNQGNQIDIVRNQYYTNTDPYTNGDADGAKTGAIEGKLRSSTDAAGLTTRYAYYSNGSVRDTYREWGDRADSFPENPIYANDIYPDSSQRPVRVIYDVWDELGNSIAGSKTEQRFVYENDRMIWATDPATADNDSHTAVRTIYDDQGNIVELRRYRNVFIRIDGTGPYTSARYVNDLPQDNDSLPPEDDIIWRSVRDSYTQYDTAGRVSVTRDANGQETETSYDKAGRVVLTVDPFDGPTINTYDIRGNLIRTVYPDRTETRTVYDEMGRLIWATDRYATQTLNYDEWSGTYYLTDDNDTTTNATFTRYDTSGRAVETRRYSGVMIRLEDDQATSVADIYTTVLVLSEPDTRTLLSSTSTVFDSIGRVVESVNADGLRTGTIYYPNGQVHYTGPLINSEPAAPADWFENSNPLQYFQNYTTTEYDRFNIDRIDVGGTIGQDDEFTVTFTDLTGTQSATVSVSGHTTAAAVMADLAQRINDSTEALFAQVDATAREEGFIQLTPAVADPRYLYTLSVTSASATFTARTSLRSTRVIDAKGHVTLSVQDSPTASRTILHDGSFTQSLKGANGQAVMDHVVSGQVITGRQETRIDQAGVATDYFYDAAGRLTDVWLAAVDDVENQDNNSETTQLRPHWQYEYDENGNQTKQIDPKGRLTVFTFDQYNRRISRKLPSITGEADAIETWTYDSFGRVDVHSDFKGQSTKYIYDDSAGGGGRLLEERRFTGVVDETPDEKTAYGYDDIGRQETVTEYANGDMLTPVRTTSYAYDAITGGVTLADSEEGIIHYAYDESTGRQRRVWTDFNDTLHGYDDLGRLETVTVLTLNGQVYGTLNQDGTVSDFPLITTYHYDAVGNLEWVLQPNGARMTYTYDALNRLDLLTVRNGDGYLLFEQDYVLESDGQRDYVVEKRYDGLLPDETAMPFSKVKIDWTYDNLNRLVAETRDSDPTPGDESHDYGTQEGEDYADAYTFDLVGNRLSKTHDAVGTDEDETIAYSYYARDQLITESSSLNGTTAYGYDLNGSTTLESSSGGDTTYSWDLRNRMVAVDGPGTSGDVAYGYNEAGIRVSRTLGGQDTVHFLIDAQNPTGYAKAILERSGTGNVPVRSYVFGHDVIAQADNGEAPIYLLKDGRGNTRALTASSGGVVEAYDFDAYGNKVSYTDGSGTPLNGDPGTVWLMPDGYRDFTTHLDRNGVRDVAGWLGVMWSRDPWGGNAAEPLTLHKYLYANANAISNTDPTGMFSVSELGVAMGIGAIFGAITGGAYSGIRYGADHIIQGAALGAAWGAVAAAGVMFGGAYVVAPLLGVSQLSGIFITNIALSGAFSAKFGYDIYAANTPRERAAATFGLIVSLLTMGLSAKGYMNVKAGRGTYRCTDPEATPQEMAAGRALADHLRVDILQQAPQGPRGLGTADFRLWLEGGRTLELKNVTATGSVRQIASRVRNAQSDTVVIILKQGQLDAAGLKQLEGSVFSPNAPGPLGPGTGKTQTIIPLYETPDGYIVGQPMERH